MYKFRERQDAGSRWRASHKMLPMFGRLPCRYRAGGSTAPPTKSYYVFSGGILPFPQEPAQSLLTELTKAQKQFSKEYKRLVDKKTRALASINPDDEFLRDACPFFTSIWLIHTLEGLHAPLPEMVNFDGQALEFTESRFPFIAEHLEEIASILDAATKWASHWHISSG